MNSNITLFLSISLLLIACGNDDPSGTGNNGQSSNVVGTNNQSTQTNNQSNQTTGTNTSASTNNQTDPNNPILGTYPPSEDAGGTDCGQDQDFTIMRCEQGHNCTRERDPADPDLGECTEYKTTYEPYNDPTADFSVDCGSSNLGLTVFCDQGDTCVSARIAFEDRGECSRTPDSYSPYRSVGVDCGKDDFDFTVSCLPKDTCVSPRVEKTAQRGECKTLETYQPFRSADGAECGHTGATFVYCLPEDSCLEPRVRDSESRGQCGT